MFTNIRVKASSPSMRNAVNSGAWVALPDMETMTGGSKTMTTKAVTRRTRNALLRPSESDLFAGSAISSPLLAGLSIHSTLISTHGDYISRYAFIFRRASALSYAGFNRAVLN